MRKWGVCNNPDSYYFDTRVYADDKLEDCISSFGRRRCGDCVYFIPLEE